MAAITYTASSRAPLITDSPAHAAGTAYSFDVKLQDYTTQIDQPRKQHVTLSGHVETVLKRAVKLHRIALIWPDTLNEQVEEFLFSVAGGESFTFDPYGTVASADDPLLVVQVGGNLSIKRMQHGSTPWRSVQMDLRPYV